MGARNSQPPIFTRGSPTAPPYVEASLWIIHRHRIFSSTEMHPLRWEKLLADPGLAGCKWKVLVQQWVVPPTFAFCQSSGHVQTRDDEP
jgi:hypothetical protein